MGCTNMTYTKKGDPINLPPRNYRHADYKQTNVDAWLDSLDDQAYLKTQQDFYSPHNEEGTTNDIVWSKPRGTCGSRKLALLRKLNRGSEVYLVRGNT